MGRMNKQLIKAGLCYLIDKDKETFIDRMSMYLQSKLELMDFLFDGPLPINNEVEQQITEYIKKGLPCPEYFKDIIDIKVDFDYSLEQMYYVTYKATRFYDTDKQPWQGVTSSDDVHKIPIVTNLTIIINPINIKS